MSFGGSGGGSGNIHTDGDVALNNPADGQVLTYSSTLGKWQNANATGGSAVTVQDEGSTLTSTPSSINFTGSGVSATNSGNAVTVTIGGSNGSGVPGAVYFDTFFSGANDNAKIASMNTYNAGIGAGSPHPAILFDTRTYNFSTAIVMYSGIKLVGGGQGPSREFSTGTVLNWQGGSGTSMLTFPGSQTSQGYPSDGSPRDMSFTNLQFNGGSSCDFITKFDPTTSSSYSGHTLWNTTFNACGWVGWNTIWWGWGDGTTICGPTHIQACNNTVFNLGGSENAIFANDGYSFADSTVTGWTTGGQPFMRTSMDKSSIGRMMFSARSNAYQLKIEAGRNTMIDGTAFDAPDSAPTYGSGIQITGCDGITITNCSFKGMMTAPSSATGGTTGNKGWITMTGGSQVVIQGCSFYRAGNNMPAENVPLIYVGASVGAGAVKWGYNNYANYSGAAVIQQANSGQIVSVTDSGLTVITG